jgi:hypothetical protein
VDDGSEVAIGLFGCGILLVNTGSIVLEINVKAICPAQIAGKLHQCAL